MDINTSHNSTSFNNESLEESDKSPIKKLNSNVTDKSEKRLLHYKPNINLRDGLSESQSRSTSFNNDDMMISFLPVILHHIIKIQNTTCIKKLYDQHFKMCQAIEIDMNVNADVDVDRFMNVDVEDLAEDIEVTHIQFSMYFIM